MENKWQIILHEQAEDTYYEITNGPISLIANCGFVGEDDADEENIFRRIFDSLDQSGINFHSGNPLELKQHIEIQKLKYEMEALQAKCERYETALSVNNEPDFIDYVRNERNSISKEMLSDEWWLEIPASKRVVVENALIAYDQMVQCLVKLWTAAANEALSAGVGDKEAEILKRGLKFYSKSMAGHIIEVLKVNKEAGTFNVNIKPTNEIGGVSWTDLWSIDGFDKYYELGNYIVKKEDKQ